MTLGAFRALPEDERDEMLAASALVCSCGNLRSVCSDPAIDWHPQESVCFASAASQWYWRQLHEKYPADKKASDGAHALDGVGVWVSDVDIAALSRAADEQVRRDDDDSHEGDLP